MTGTECDAVDANFFVDDVFSNDLPQIRHSFLPVTGVKCEFPKTEDVALSE